MSAEMEPPPATPAPEGKYVYCIIETKEPRSFGPIGIGGRGDEVYTVHHDGLAAVVSNTPIQVYDPTRENVFAHEQVNETVMREFTVLPMAFGVLFRTEDDIMELMRGTYDALRDVLAKMENKVEFGLKVNWDRERVIAELEEESEEIRNLKEQITSRGAGSTYFARMQLGRLIESALTEKSEAYVREIYAGLRDTAVASRANKPIGDKMIMNAAFLIERDREAEFDAIVKEIASQYEGKLSFKYTGPWPPYNFVHIRLKLERGEGAA
ncbi:MAG: gas vesicle synthesis GvpLGvpF [Acidobacteria bacterium]|nr:MAG: gas vesicle synthesis GvpLGvpF [Acidobacteriota bacterium]PYS85208.1 MAG: gas vesicle synthesis GvpLGvpF [Acidobacteriota bacterium]